MIHFNKEADIQDMQFYAAVSQQLQLFSIELLFEIIPYIMEKDQFIALINNFDQFVQLELERKTTKHIRQPLQNTHVQNYRLGMEKRLKLKPPSQEEKFNKILAPMKNLKSFVSVKEFMEKLGTNKFLTQSKGKKVRQQTEIKQQYESIRGGYYLKKVEQHLKNKKFKRQKSTPFVTEIEEDPLNPTQFKTWIDQTLNKITPRPEQMFRSNTEVQTLQKLSMQDVLMQEHKTQYKQQFKVINNIHQFSSQQYQKFSKISSLLTNRLRKLLKSNCGRASKTDFRVEEGNQSLNKYSYTQRVTAKTRPTAPINKKKQVNRVKTAGTARKQEVVWRQNVNNKFKYILQTQEEQQIYKSD